MEPLNDHLRREIPMLARAPSSDAPDGMVHAAWDVLFRPVWDDTAAALSPDPAVQEAMRRRLWQILDERIAGGDVIARVAFERWLLGAFVSNAPETRALLSEVPARLAAVIGQYAEESSSFVAALYGARPEFGSIIDATVDDYDGLVLLTSILDRLSDRALPPRRDADQAPVALGDMPQDFVDVLERWIGVNGYIDEAIRETIVEALRYSGIRGRLRLGPRLRGLGT